MKIRLLIGAAAMLAAHSASAAVYAPTGVQLNVALSTVTSGGWSLCYSGAYGERGASLAGIAASCTGTNMMLAARQTGSDTLLLLAQAPKVDVMFDVGPGSGAVHEANGTNWYYDENSSWGFARADQAVARSSCDASGVFNNDTANQEYRLCWHTGGGALDGGWRAGSATSLNDSSAYERLVFTSNLAAVPEPASWAMMIGGFGLLGAAARRRTRASLAHA